MAWLSSLFRCLAASVVLLASCAPPVETDPDSGVIDGGGDGDADSDADGDGGPICASDNECDDRIACTIDHCEDGRCTHSPCPDCCPEGLTCIVDFGCGQAPTPCTTDDECIDDTACTLDRCQDRTFCQHLPQNGLCDEGEICLAALGCIPRPPDDCDVDEDCLLDDPCLGEWYCDPEFACQFLGLLDCDDGDPCTDDLCDEEAGGCVHPPHDGDGDGHGDEDCGGDDCDDSDPERHPSADEACNGIDDDCDGEVDEGCCLEGEPCETECGSEGTRECLPDGSGGACRPPDETCNGADDDCDGEVDEGFECGPMGSDEPCETECGSTGSRRCSETCTWEPCEPPAEECNGLDDDCDGTPDEGFPCVAGHEAVCSTSCGSIGTRACLRDCTWDVCAPPPEECNGVDDDCDGACDDGFGCCAGTTRDCSVLGFYAGTATCPGDCSGWDTSTCTNCGNGRLDEGEQCDDTDLGGNDCTTIDGDFGGGTLGCTAGCRFDTAGCHRCGNDRVDDGEECDGGDLDGEDCISRGYSGGELSCGDDCAFDESECSSFDPTGIYALVPVPRYRCAEFMGIYFVDFTVDDLYFEDNGVRLSVESDEEQPCDMRGPPVTEDGDFDVTCTIEGSCDETYRLIGTFIDDDTWEGVFEVEFSGASCLDCRDRSWSVTGSR